MSKKTQVVYSDFFCMKCGAKITLPRKKSHLWGAYHRKRLYCYSCKQELNFIECRNAQEIEIFKENFANGVYKDESEESVEFCN